MKRNAKGRTERRAVASAVAPTEGNVVKHGDRFRVLCDECGDYDEEMHGMLRYTRDAQGHVTVTLRWLCRWCWCLVRCERENAAPKVRPEVKYGAKMKSTTVEKVTCFAEYVKLPRKEKTYCIRATVSLTLLREILEQEKGKTRRRRAQRRLDHLTR